MARQVRRDSVRSRLLHRCLDIGINWLALTLAYLLKQRLQIGIPTAPLTGEVVAHTFAIIGLIWLTVCSALEIYSYKRRLSSEIVNLIATLALTIAFFNTYVYFTRLFVFPRYFMVLYPVVGSALLTLSRVIKHVTQRALHRRGHGVRRVIIVGAGEVAHRLARTLRENPALAYHFLGFIHEGRGAPTAGDHLGGLNDLEQVIQRQNAHEVIVALPGREHELVLDIAHRCQAANIRLHVVPDLFEVTMIRATAWEIDDIPLIGLRDPVLTAYQNLVKRAFDIAVALFCLVLALPLLIIIPVIILLDSRGRVFFAQMRVGENGKLFRMYKFRSMVHDAETRLKDLVKIEDLPQPVFKILDDPRVTRFGRFLRRTSLDELPQLINVLKGDMSMVGPRPEEVQVVNRYKLWHRRRLSVRPGITGPMQVSGRGVLPLDERIKLELLYIHRYSIVEDLKYLLRTIPAVCRARGAY